MVNIEQGNWEKISKLFHERVNFRKLYFYRNLSKKYKNPENKIAIKEFDIDELVPDPVTVHGHGV
jgi:hypothetical protein